MHRRQFIPCSQVKISRKEQLEINERLKDQIRLRDEAEARRLSDLRAATTRREQSGIRGFVNKAKRVLTQPVRLGRRATS